MGALSPSPFSAAHTENPSVAPSLLRKPYHGFNIFYDQNPTHLSIFLASKLEVTWKFLEVPKCSMSSSISRPLHVYFSEQHVFLASIWHMSLIPGDSIPSKFFQDTPYASLATCSFYLQGILC